MRYFLILRKRVLLSWGVPDSDTLTIQNMGLTCWSVIPDCGGRLARGQRGDPLHRTHSDRRRHLLALRQGEAARQNRLAASQHLCHVGRIPLPMEACHFQNRVGLGASRAPPSALEHFKRTLPLIRVHAVCLNPFVPSFVCFLADQACTLKRAGAPQLDVSSSQGLWPCKS